MKLYAVYDSEGNIHAAVQVPEDVHIRMQPDDPIPQFLSPLPKPEDPGPQIDIPLPQAGEHAAVFDVPAEFSERNPVEFLPRLRVDLKDNTIRGAS